ncbi:MAG: ribonuclease III [Deltaproteobacteria bacterium]|nr:ribonuclease III [Deltaproteobacteria bacterium]
MESRIDKKKLKELEKRLGYSFRSRALLVNALTHKSYANEAHLELTEDNERLEFLGDTVLELVVSELLMEKFPLVAEGDLSKLRAAIVNEKQLADMSRSLHLGEYLLLGKGEEQTKGREKSSLLADVYEALLGAIYKDRGFKKAAAFIRRNYRDSIPTSTETVLYQDYKTLLQEKSQALFKEIPRYRMLREHGPDHSKTFEVNLFIQERLYGVGSGKSKKEAEQSAAHMALEQLEAESISVTHPKVGNNGL